MRGRFGSGPGGHETAGAIVVAEGLPALQAAILQHENELFELAERVTSIDGLLIAFATVGERYI